MQPPGLGVPLLALWGKPRRLRPRTNLGRKTFHSLSEMAGNLTWEGRLCTRWEKCATLRLDVSGCILLGIERGNPVCVAEKTWAGFTISYTVSFRITRYVEEVRGFYFK